MRSRTTAVLTAVCLAACAHEGTNATQAEAPKSNRLHGKIIAVLATDGFEQDELIKPRQLLIDEGATVVVIAPHAGSIQGMKHDEKGELVQVDATLTDVDPMKFDALVLPGGVANPDSLRTNADAVALVRAFASQGKPIAAICHGPWTLIEADAVRGKTVTSWPSLKTDLINAGAKWVDEEVVVDANLITSRKPADIPVFVENAVRVFERNARPPEVQPQRTGLDVVTPSEDVLWAQASPTTQGAPPTEVHASGTGGGAGRTPQPVDAGVPVPVRKER